ncbi:MAG TPA: TIGR02757 family protein [Dissulfurispiraceae bacterium]|nr:TIGR02757 family protein [Dissulfurispiraceae bacterium]
MGAVSRPKAAKHAALQKLLDSLYASCNFSSRLSSDPIEFPHRYKRSSDIEVVALIAAVLAYGKVDLFKSVTERILSPMGESPADFLQGFSRKRDAKRFAGLRYRFNTNDDIIALLDAVHQLLRRYGSLKAAFFDKFHPDDVSVEKALVGFVRDVISIPGEPAIAPPGFLQLFPSPVKGSACKRLNLFLRWMVRDKDIDFGLWTEIPKSSLVVPLDLHIGRIARCFGLTSRKSDDWKTAVEITDSLSAFCPEDPLRYDFALCHMGISGGCGEKHCPTCDTRKWLV